MANETVLIIEDEKDILDILQFNLERDGFGVLTADNGKVGLEKAIGSQPDIIILDLMLPDLDGIEVCRQVKANNSTISIPIIMLTAKGEESDIILGLGLGADDYVVKPFKPKELLARIKAVLRRYSEAGKVKEEKKIQVDGLEINSESYKVIVDDKVVPFTLREFRILYYLAANPDRVLTREQLLNEVFGQDVHVVDRNVDVHIRSVRKKLGQYKEYIQTIRGVGYLWQSKDNLNV